jgi:hypothetical protein
MMTTHEYAFDVKLFAGITVRAKSEAEARKWIEQHAHEISVTIGSITFKAEMDEPENDELVAIDGEPV